MNLKYRTLNVTVILINFSINFTVEFLLAEISCYATCTHTPYMCILEFRKCIRQMHSSFIGFCLPSTGNHLNKLMYRGNQPGTSVI